MLGPEKDMSYLSLLLMSKRRKIERGNGGL
jgi:hypothetical protein